MPIYEYKCGKCGEKFELLRSMSDNDADARCPKCGAEKPQRAVSAFASSTGSGSSSGGICAPGAST